MICRIYLIVLHRLDGSDLWSNDSTVSMCVSDVRIRCSFVVLVVVVVDLPLLRVAVEGSDNPIYIEKPCHASLSPDQQRQYSLGRHPKVQYAV